MKTAEEILKGKLNPSIAILNNPDYTFNKVIEAMEEYANQFKHLHLHSVMQAEGSDVCVNNKTMFPNFEKFTLMKQTAEDSYT